MIYNFFAIFENGQTVANQVYFYEFYSKNSANFEALLAKFSFSKNHKDIKKNFIRKLGNTLLFYITELSPKIKFKIFKFLNFFILGPHNGQIGF